MIIPVNALESYKDQYKIVILGGSGQLGSELKKIDDNNYFLFFPNRNDLDLRSEHEISNFFNNNEFDLIINLAAYTDVDKAEIEKEEALLLNHTVPRILAQETNKSNIGLIHISTDYVFGNKSLGPFDIDSQKDPINHYGLSKSLGEDDVLQFNNKSMVIRMASVFSIYGKNFVKTIMNYMKEKNQLEVVSDQLISVTSAYDFSNNLISLVDLYRSQINKPFDRIMHFTNKEFTSWYQMAEFILKEMNKNGKIVDCELKPIELSKWEAEAKRPIDSRLSVDFSFMEKNDIFIPHWKESLKETVKKLL